MTTIPSLLLAALLALPVSHAPADDSSAPHVRPKDATAARLIADGRTRSLIVRSMLGRLERGHVIVMVHTTNVLDHPGELTLLGTNGSYRYLSISIKIPAVEYDAVTWLAHELQHAIEILDAPEVVDGRTLALYARKLGMVCHADGEFESDEAQRVWDRVRHELLQDPPPPEEYD